MFCFIAGAPVFVSTAPESSSPAGQSPHRSPFACFGKGGPNLALWYRTVAVIQGLLHELLVGCCEGCDESVEVFGVYVLMQACSHALPETGAGLPEVQAAAVVDQTRIGSVVPTQDSRRVFLRLALRGVLCVRRPRSAKPRSSVPLVPSRGVVRLSC